MKNNLFLTLFVAVLFLAACKNENAKTPTQGDDSIAGLEKSLEATLDKDKAEKLVAQYQQYIDEHPDDKVTNAKYLYRTASLYYRQNQYPAAAEKLMEVLTTYKGSEVSASSLHLLGDLYKNNMNYPSLGADLHQYLVKTYPKYEELATVKKNITTDSKPLAERVTEIAGKIYDETNTLPNTRMARKYITACEVNGLVNPGDPKAAELLFKAATTARTTVRNPEQALRIYDWIYNEFSNYEKSYHALFMKAFTLDDEMKQFDEAKKYYQKFLDKYPNDEFAVSSKFLLENLGKSDDEIIKQFEKK
ncbi:MAG: tol-pal system YbgF family protein [Saprospiraceae bacterium]